MSATTALNPKRYRLLLEKAMPIAIETCAEHERMLAAAERLMDKGENLLPEEGRLLKLIATLIEDYEQRNHALRKAAPHEMLKYLLEEKSLRASALWPVLGSKGRVSEILSGRRSISKAQAKKLAQFFHTSTDLFI